MNATCYHICTIRSQILINYPSFLYEHVHVYENKLYKLSLYQTWRLSVVTTSSAMPGCHAEQLEFLVNGIRFTRFYFRTISLPNLSNRNHSLPARVQAFRCRFKYFLSTYLAAIFFGGADPFTRQAILVKPPGCRGQTYVL